MLWGKGMPVPSTAGASNADVAQPAPGWGSSSSSTGLSLNRKAGALHLGTGSSLHFTAAFFGCWGLSASMGTCLGQPQPCEPHCITHQGTAGQCNDWEQVNLFSSFFLYGAPHVSSVIVSLCAQGPWRKGQHCSIDELGVTAKHFLCWGGQSGRRIIAGGFRLGNLGVPFCLHATVSSSV